MNALTRFFCGREPRIDPGRILRRDGTLCIRGLFGSKPENIPSVPPPDGTVLKDSRSVNAYLFGERGNYRLFVKIYKFRGIFHSIKYAFRTPRAFRCFAAAEALFRKGFFTPLPLCAIVKLRFGIFPVRQILVTDAVPSETGFLDRELAAAPSPDAARTILRELAVFAAKLHQAGLLHGDLSLRNICRVPGDKKFGLIDLDSLLIARKPFPRTAAIGELARIVSDAFRLRPDLPRDLCMTEVLREYHAAGGMDLRPEELAPVFRRLGKHRPHAPARH